MNGHNGHLRKENGQRIKDGMAKEIDRIKRERQDADRAEMVQREKAAICPHTFYGNHCEDCGRDAGDIITDLRKQIDAYREELILR